MPKWLTEAELRSRFSDDRIDFLADLDDDGSPDAGVAEAAIDRAEDRVETELRASPYKEFADADFPTTTGEASKVLKEAVGGITLRNLAEGQRLEGEGDIAEIFEDALRLVGTLKRGGPDLLWATPPSRPARASVLTTEDREDRLSPSNMADW